MKDENIQKILLEAILTGEVLCAALKYSEEKDEVIDGCSYVARQIQQKLKQLLS
ncbi:MAG: hypothetical protein PHX18_07675 [Candidatus Gastranaerophilales bacterium]|nr:hypothetical protein [Candidatus Gastranaerophilales bacterium]